ncbi:DUF2316 family protein [Lacisediminihabitans sp. H27-G8]|uniref:DUF2316 family protein n=1 Tax=Lacisediminihabitans sp. H27-G8 TaxID=3111909 RepID=UPI0038FCA538
MSLSRAQREATSAELRANLVISEATQEELLAALGVTDGELTQTFAVDGAPPARVWALRDYLDKIITRRGRTPAPYTSLTPQMRSSAQRWFPCGHPAR